MLEQKIQASNNNLIKNDDIDLLHLFKTLWLKKVSIFITVILCVVISIIYSLVSPKQYQSTAIFFIASSEQNTSLAGYASVLGIKNNSNIEALVKGVLKSRSMQKKVAENYINNFDSEIKKAINKKEIKNEKKHIIDFVVKELKLKKDLTFKISKDGLFELSYSSNDKSLVKKILDDYLNSIIAFNERLALSVEKNIITIIDPPEEPLKSYKPDLVLNIIMSIVFGIAISFATILFLPLFKVFKQEITT